MDFHPSAELQHFVDERKIEIHGISISKMRCAITLCVTVACSDGDIVRKVVTLAPRISLGFSSLWISTMILSSPRVPVSRDSSARS